MAHKYVSKSTVSDLEEEIAACESSIERIRIISRGGSEGMKELLAQVVDFRSVASEKKNQGLDLLMTNGAGSILDPKLQEKSALICRGQEKAFDIVIQMLENPHEAIHYYEQQIAAYRKELDGYRKLEQRTE